jgi:acyl dehydratase
MTETKKTPEEMLADAKKMIGTEGKTKKFRYPVEYEPIRRYCAMVDDDNPLFLDPEYAAKTKYGNVVLPPFASFGIMNDGNVDMMKNLTATALDNDIAMPPTPGKYLINMGQEWEFFKPVVVGDWLSAKTRLGDVYIKPTRVDPKSFWIVTEFHYSNQNGEKVCVIKNILLSHRSPEEVAED